MRGSWWACGSVKGSTSKPSHVHTALHLASAYAEPIAELIDSGHLLHLDGHLRLTDRGRLVIDAVLARLVAADDATASSAAE